MESDSIAAVDVGKLNRVTPYLSRLVVVSRRVQADRDFKYIGEDISKVEEQLKDKSVSLNEAHVVARTRRRPRKSWRREGRSVAHVRISGRPSRCIVGTSTKGTPRSS